MNPIVHLTLLGPFSLRLGDRPGAAGVPARLPELLAVLVLQPQQAHPRRDLAFQLWPDTPEAQAQTNLRKLIHFLRTALPALLPAVEIEARALRWVAGPAVVCDLAVFQTALARAAAAAQAGDPPGRVCALQEAVAAYGGDLLRTADADWLVPVREQVRRTFFMALEQLIVLLEQGRDYPAAIAAAQRLVAEDPLHEASYRYLMRLYAAAGDRAGAVHAYHTCTTVLERELGIAPSPATQAAYATLLAAAPALGPPRPHLVAESSLIGRQAEWAALQAAWAAAQAGRPGLVLLTGDGGIGKTRLAEEFLARAAHQGIATATAHCYAAEAGLAYGPVIAWLRAQLRRAGSAAWSPELARLLPELGAPPPLPADLAAPGGQHRFFEALARALLPAHPCLYLLDDLQWCDPETLAWLPFLLRSDPPAPLLIVGTVRPDELDAHHPLHELLTGEARAGRLREIALGPLDAAETAALATAVAPTALSAVAARRLYGESEGNPLLVVEMVRAALEPAPPGALSLARPPHGASPLPPRVRALFQARLAPLSAEARAVVNLAAVIGREFSVPLLARTSSLAEEPLVGALDELWHRRIIREQGVEAYDFSHDKLREVVYTGLSPIRRRMLHRQVAQALDTAPGLAGPQVNGEIAAHYAQAGLPADALHYYRQAADAALAIFAPATAVQALERAIALLPAAQERAPTGDWAAVQATLYAGLHTALAQTGTLVAQEGRPALSPLQQRKIARVFAAFDGNDDGFMEAADHVRMAQAVVALHGWAPGSPQYATVESIYLSAWAQLQPLVVPGAPGVGLGAYQAFMAAAMGDPVGFAAATRPGADYLFDAFDVDGDGRWSVTEYADFLRVYRSTARDAAAVFARLDTDRDGTIRKDDFYALFCDFQLSRDPQAPGNWLLGPF